jgi:hypothetical protein
VCSHLCWVVEQPALASVLASSAVACLAPLALADFNPSPESRPRLIPRRYGVPVKSMPILNRYTRARIAETTLPSIDFGNPGGRSAPG